MSTYVIVKCPRCLSTSLVKITSAANEDFICPVCSEGQIESPTRPDNLSGGEYKIPLLWEDLAVLWPTSR
jgi:ribosomal protein S27E